MRAFRIGRIPTEIFCELVTVVAIIRPTGADEYVFLLELQDADPDKWWRMLKDQWNTVRQWNIRGDMIAYIIATTGSILHGWKCPAWRCPNPSELWKLKQPVISRDFDPVPTPVNTTRVTECVRGADRFDYAGEISRFQRGKITQDFWDMPPVALGPRMHYANLYQSMGLWKTFLRKTPVF